MLDRLGTLVGFMVGAGLIVFGVTWPDHRSNYYVYQLQQFEERAQKMQAAGATRAEIAQLEQQLEQFRNSWLAGFARFMDLKSVLLVLGGSYAAILIAFPLRYAVRTLNYIFMVFSRDRHNREFEVVYEKMIEFANSRYQNELIPDEKVNAIPLYFMRDAMENFIQVDWVSEAMVREIISSQIESYAFSQSREISVMEYMGRAAPAFGMLGTVVGLILLLGRAAVENANIAGIMGGMSVALITTLYGVLLAQLIFLPVAAKLTRNKESYIRLYEMIMEGILYLHRRERPDVVEQDMRVYLSNKKRMALRAERYAEIARGELNL